MFESIEILFNTVLNTHNYHILDEKFNRCQDTKLYSKAEWGHLSKWFVNPVAKCLDNVHYTCHRLCWYSKPFRTAFQQTTTSCRKKWITEGGRRGNEKDIIEINRNNRKKWRKTGKWNKAGIQRENQGIKKGKEMRIKTTNWRKNKGMKEVRKTKNKLKINCNKKN